jgi:hypothetical protein
MVGRYHFPFKIQIGLMSGGAKLVSTRLPNEYQKCAIEKKRGEKR